MYNTTKPITDRILELIESCKRDVPASTDGIGTKGIYHWQQRSFRNAVLDALAMNLNDMAVLRARVIGVHNHIIIPEDDDEAIEEIIKTFVRECGKRDIFIDSGETAIHDDFKGVEISVSVTGEYVKKRKNEFEEGDYLIGIKSNGLHSNGFTKIRKLFGKEYRPEFVEPTFIYSDALLDLIKKVEINGMVHITGGAYIKLKQLLKNTDAVINNEHGLIPHTIFKELYERGVSDKGMYKTFNCGIGFILSVFPKDAKNVISNLRNFGFDAEHIGVIVSGTGKVRINSMFSQEEVIL